MARVWLMRVRRRRWWVLAQQRRSRVFALHRPSAPCGMNVGVKSMRTGLLLAILCCLGEVMA